jgi:cytochrome b561
MNSSSKYTRTAIVLHWFIALLIGANLCLAWVVDYLPDEMERPIIDTHKSIGITVLGLALLRLLWRFSHRPPPLPHSYSRLERAGAALAHTLLYVVILALPLSGWMHDSAWKDAATHPMKLYALIPWPRLPWIMNLDPGLKETMHDVFGRIHEYFGYLLYVLVVLHIAGALKHQFVDRDAELQRILP